MFDAPFDDLAILIAIVAFLIAIKATSQATELRRRLNSLEAMLYAQRQVQPPPLMPSPAPEAPATMAPEPPPLAPETELAPPPVAEQVSPPALEPSTDNVAPPPVPAAEPGFEERLGTRWVVWIGGLALALGGFFMVRYSIEIGRAHV